MTKTKMLVSALLGSASLGIMAMPAYAADKSADATKAEKKADSDENKDIVVTGVFSATKIERTPISVNVVTSAQISEHAAVSAADLLKNVPGVFVNSSLGEIRNVVFSRGISANSLDGAGGYYYVSLQEDGLPTTLVTASNYGPDYFLRSDLNLSRLEGLRGGTAAVTGPNAPGGIFNYISKTGKSDPGVEVDAKFGLEGNGKNPYYRTDIYAGGKLSENVYYSIGGFYRVDRGSHDPGYDDNKGGQIHGNILYDYGAGSLLFTAKYLDDHNDWNEFTPALGGTTIAPGFTNTSSDLPPANSAHCFPKYEGGTECWNPTGLVHSRQTAIGLNWKHDLESGFHFDNKMRYAHNTADWNTGAVISAVPINDFITQIIEGTAFSPGTFNFYNHNTGALVATIAGVGVGPVVYNNLPNQNVLANGVYTQVAFVQHYKADDFVDQATLTKDLGTHHLALGGYIALAKLRNDSESGGIGLSTLENQPVMLTETYTDPTGKVFQVTDPSGFTGQGSAVGTNYHGKQNQYSVFFGDTWKVTPKLTIDLGGRYESIDYDIFNQLYNSTNSATGGADGNPLTLYDNNVSTIGAVLETKRSYHFFNYSGSVAYQFSSNFDAYIRYTSGKKAPDFGSIQAINSASAIATQFPSPQKIEQLEMGFKYHESGFDIQVFPFYSHLSNVTTPQTFTNTNKNSPQFGQFYSPPPIAGEITTYGVEISASGRIAETLTGHANLTLQSPKAKNFGSYVQGSNGDGTNDVASIIPEGDADNNPKIILRGGLDWKPVSIVTLFGELSYLGKRAANEYNAFYLPGYGSLDIGGKVQITKAIKLQANITNVTNSVGVLSWSQSGGFLASLDRQGLVSPAQGASGKYPGVPVYNPATLYPIVPSQARAFFLTLGAKF